MSDKHQRDWLGYPILSDEHGIDLERRAAVNEFHHKMPRSQAEARAYATYKQEHHAKAAAHHLRGMKAARAIGDSVQAQKHGALYEMHVKELGHDSFGPVPEAVKRFEREHNEGFYRFKAHPADSFLLQPTTHKPDFDPHKE